MSYQPQLAIVLRFYEKNSARLIAPKQDLIALAEDQREGNRILSGWRYEIFGHMVENSLLES